MTQEENEEDIEAEPAQYSSSNLIYTKKPSEENTSNEKEGTIEATMQEKEEDNFDDAKSETDECEEFTTIEDTKTFYLFTRTSREKEEWYGHFMIG